MITIHCSFSYFFLVRVPEILSRQVLRGKEGGCEREMIVSIQSRGGVYGNPFHATPSTQPASVLEDGPTYMETRRSAVLERQLLRTKQALGCVEMRSLMKIDMERVPAPLRDRGNARSS